MRRNVAVVLMVGGALAACSSANAQYGWGGWGGGGTVAGNNAMGAGMLAQGLGSMNVQDAQAQSIRTNNVMKWNDYMWSSQNNVNLEYARRKERERTQNISANNAIQERLRSNPTQGDITSGSALNAALEDLSNPKVFSNALKRAGAITMSSQVAKQIRWFHASDAISFSLMSFTSDQNWPSFLKTADFAEDRAAFKTVMEKVFDEDYNGHPSDGTIEELRGVLRKLYDKIKAKFPEGTPERVQADRRAKTAAGLIKMLQDPVLGPALAGLDKVSQVTLADVLSFAMTFNLRFGSAMNAREQAAYREVFGMLDGIRDDIAKGSAIARTEMPTDHDHAQNVLGDMKWEAVDPGMAPAPPRPEAAKP